MGDRGHEDDEVALRGDGDLIGVDPVISGLEFRVLDVEEFVGVLTGDGVEGAVLGDVLVEVGVDAGKGLGLAGGGVVEGLGGAGLDDGYGVNPVGAIRLGEDSR